MSRGKSATLSIVIAGDATGASKAMKQAEVDASALGDKIKSTAADMARAFVAAKGIGFAKEAIDDAAALEQAQGQVDFIFGQSAGTVKSFGEQAAESIGQSEKQALEAATGYGTLLSSMGIAEEQAASMSETLVRLASDMAAARDVPVDQAINALFSGLSGEQEPLKRFGVLLNEATVKAKAMEVGLYNGEGAISNQARALATYQVILENTAVYQGAMARESDTLTAQQMRMNAEWENAKIELGQGLVPAMKVAVTTGTDMIRVWSGLPAPLQAGIIALGGIALGGRHVGTAVNALIDVYPRWNSHLRNNVSNLSKQQVALAAVAAGITSYTLATQGLERLSAMQSIDADADRLVTALTRLGETGEVRGELQEYGADLDELAAAFERAGRSDARKLWDALGGPSPDAGTGLQAALDDIDKVDKALADLAATDPEAASAAFGQIAAAMIRQGHSAEDVARRFDNYHDAVEDAEIATEGHTGAVEEDTKATEDSSRAQERRARAYERMSNPLRRAAEQTERLYDKWQEKVSAEDALIAAQEASADAQEELAEARRAAAGDSDEYRDAVKAVEDAERGLEDAQRGVVDAQEGVSDALRGVEDAHQAVADARDDEKEAHEGYRESLRSVQEAQESLTQARADAAQKIRDLARAARDAVLDEAEANLAVRKAKIELDRIMADQTATPLERDEARLKLQQALEAQRQAGEDRRSTAQEAADAERRGVEGAQEVIDARQRVADAHKGVEDALKRVDRAARSVRDAEDGVTDAWKRVRDAERGVVDAKRRVTEAEEQVGRASKRVRDIRTEASKRVTEAQKRVERAALDEAQAVGDVVAAHEGAAAGIQAHREQLLLLADQLDPRNPLRKRIEAMVRALGGVLGPYNRANQPGSGPPPVHGGGPDGHLGGPGRPTPGSPGARSIDTEQEPVVGGRAVPMVSVTQHIHGSDVEVAREADRRMRRTLDDAAVAMTGG